MIKDVQIEMIEADVRDAEVTVDNCPSARAVRRHFSNNTGKPAIEVEAAITCVLADGHYWDLDDSTSEKIRHWDRAEEWALPHTITLMYAFEAARGGNRPRFMSEASV